MSDVHVYADLAGRTVRVGTAYLTVRRGQVTTTFVYDSTYLADPGAYALEPRLPLTTGQQYIDGLPGAFADSAPDRWGRNLIDKRRRILQRESRNRLPAATAHQPRRHAWSPATDTAHVVVG